jgi:putative protease
MDIVEDVDGTYLYNAKDLCLADRVGELINMRAASLKIEGRMKSVMYTAVVTGVYRKIIDEVKKNPDFKAGERLKWLLSSVSNRHYTEGFYSVQADKDCMNYETSAYVRDADFLGIVTGGRDGGLAVECRGRFGIDEKLAVLRPDLSEAELNVEYMEDKSGTLLDYTKPGQEIFIKTDLKAPEGSLLRRILKMEYDEKIILD